MNLQDTIDWLGDSIIRPQRVNQYNLVALYEVLNNKTVTIHMLNEWRVSLPYRIKAKVGPTNLGAVGDRLVGKDTLTSLKSKVGLLINKDYNRDEANKIYWMVKETILVGLMAKRDTDNGVVLMMPATATINIVDNKSWWDKLVIMIKKIFA